MAEAEAVALVMAVAVAAMESDEGEEREEHGGILASLGAGSRGLHRAGPLPCKESRRAGPHGAHATARSASPGAATRR